MLGNGTMAVGFLLLCMAVGIWGGGDGLRESFLLVGGGLITVGFVGKLMLWRCPVCGAHLMLCVRGRAGTCPVCGSSLCDASEKR